MTELAHRIEPTVPHRDDDPSLANPSMTIYVMVMVVMFGLIALGFAAVLGGAVLLSVGGPG